MGLTGTLSRLASWVFRTAEIRATRARIGAAAEGRPLLQQARLLIEVARRVEHPVDGLPPGSRPALLVALYRDAVHAALLSVRRAADPDAGTDTGTSASARRELETLWTDSQTLLRGAVGDQAELAAARTSLCGPSLPDAVNLVRTEDGARARALALALVQQLSVDERCLDRLLTRRWALGGAFALLALTATLGGRVLLEGPDLAAGRPLRPSSVEPTCAVPLQCGKVLFHTLEEENPWVEIDLGAIQAVRRVEVKNRTDCCWERVVPLVVEVSSDRAQWIEVARRDHEFIRWTASFSRRHARYVRLRVAALSTLHLEEIAVR